MVLKYTNTNRFIHSKVILVDGIAAVVGTVNFDYRSLYLHLECAVWMYDTECITAIKGTLKTLCPYVFPLPKPSVSSGRFGNEPDNGFAPLRPLM